MLPFLHGTFPSEQPHESLAFRRLCLRGSPAFAAARSQWVNRCRQRQGADAGARRLVGEATFQSPIPSPPPLRKSDGRRSLSLSLDLRAPLKKSVARSLLRSPHSPHRFAAGFSAPVGRKTLALASPKRKGEAKLKWIHLWGTPRPRSLAVSPTLNSSAHFFSTSLLSEENTVFGTEKAVFVGGFLFQVKFGAGVCVCVFFWSGSPVWRLASGHDKTPLHLWQFRRGWLRKKEEEGNTSRELAPAFCVSNRTERQRCDVPSQANASEMMEPAAAAGFSALDALHPLPQCVRDKATKACNISRLEERKQMLGCDTSRPSDRDNQRAPVKSSFGSLYDFDEDLL